MSNVTCVSCYNTPVYVVRPTGSIEQVYCELHFPQFLKGRVDIVTPFVAEAVVEEKPKKSRKTKADVVVNEEVEVDIPEEASDESDTTDPN